jgi:hypothetical protein
MLMALLPLGFVLTVTKVAFAKAVMGYRYHTQAPGLVSIVKQQFPMASFAFAVINSSFARTVTVCLCRIQNRFGQSTV